MLLDYNDETVRSVMLALFIRLTENLKLFEQATVICESTKTLDYTKMMHRTIYLNI